MKLSHEQILYLVNRPSVMLFAEAIKGFDYLNVPKLGYIINDPKLASDILMHPHFTSSGQGAMGGLISPLVGKYGLFNMDGEQHHTLKHSLMRVFTKRYVETIIQLTLPDMLDNLRSRLIKGETIDFVAFTNAMTTRIMLHMLGIDVHMDNIEPIAIASNRAIESFTSVLELNKTSLTPTELKNVQHNIAILNDMIDEHGQYQDGALLFRLIEMGLSEQDARGLMMVILAAGTETTNVTLPRVLALLLDTDQFKRLREQPELMNNAIDEGIRVTSASPVIIRAIETDTTIGKYHFKAGRRALLLVYNLMKHRKYLSNPYQFDIRREIDPTLKYLSFGRGHHFCLGFPLAHREIEVTLETLLTIPTQPQIVSRRYPRGQTFPGYTQLMIRL